MQQAIAREQTVAAAVGRFDNHLRRLQPEFDPKSAVGQLRRTRCVCGNRP